MHTQKFFLRTSHTAMEKEPSSSSSLSSSASPSSSCSPRELVARWIRSKSLFSDPPPCLPWQSHEGLVLYPLRYLLCQPGRIVCSLRVPPRLTNSSQFLHEGVIASLVDNVGAAVFVAFDGHVRVSVDLNVSYMSPARVDDEVEIDAKVLKKGTSVVVVVVDVTNKTSGELVAQGRHTMYYPVSKL